MNFEGPIVAALVAVAAFPAAARAGKATKVIVGNGFYGPADVTVKKDAKVRWNWDGGFELHDVNVKSGPARFHSPTQAAGTYSHKFAKPGKYVLYCTQHEDMTMKVTVKRALNTPRARQSARGEPFRRSRRVATARFGSSRPAMTSTKSSKRTCSSTSGSGRAAGAGGGRAVVQAQVPRLGVRELPLQRHRALGGGARVDRAADAVEQQRHRLRVARGAAVLLAQVAGAQHRQRARGALLDRQVVAGRSAARAATRAGARPSAAWTRTSARPRCRSPRA